MGRVTWGSMKILISTTGFNPQIGQEVRACDRLQDRNSRVFAKSKMHLSQRNPSVNWEPVPLDPSGRCLAWVWFRPAAIPTGLIVVVPLNVLTDSGFASRISLRQLIAAAGLDPGQILGWSVGGMSIDAAGGKSPFLDQVLTSPNGANLEISVWMMPATAAGWAPIGPGHPPASPVHSNGTSSEDSQLLEALDDCWKGVMQLEVRVSSLRKDLATSISRLNSINRDLNTDERRFCDSSDLQEWSEARRWLRDSVLVLSKSVKEIDTGTTSGAGKRNAYNEIYRNHVVPRIPFPGLMQTANEFDTYRKILQSLVASAQANVMRAGRDAENRANTVLQRIAAKVRTRRRMTK